MNLEKSLELDVIKEQMKSFCSFSAGIKEIEELHPSYNILEIQRRLQQLREALECTVHYGPIPFYGIKDIRTALISAEKGVVLNGQQLVDVIHLIQGVKGIVSYERSLLDIEHPALKDLIGTLTIHERTEHSLSRCLNDYGEVMDSASPELKGIRSALRHADHEILSAVNRFIATNPDSVVDSIVTYRSGRALILVKASDKNSFGGLVYGDSASGQASYIEPASIMGANNKKQELLHKEEEEVQRILTICSGEVAEIALEEVANIETCAILDCIFAKAEWGKAHDGYAASLSEEKEISLIKARHPLIDPKKVVANNYHLKAPQKTLLITGPNTGGKTVSMKIVGLFVLMSYCGMPVTCEEAVLPYFDQVFADIGDDQSVVESLSSFSSHIQKQAEVCRNATSDSLVLLDEVGSGTDPREGESLAIAILNELRKRGCMTIATTHYSRLKAYGKRHSDILVSSVQFDMEKLEPTYKYMEGFSGSSNAFAVAQRYGLPASIIKYARFLKEQAKTTEDELIERLEKQLQETGEKEEELKRQLKEAQEKTEQLEKEKIRFEKEKDDWHNQLQQKTDAYVEEVKKEADEILKEIREKQMNSQYHEVLGSRKKLNKLSSQPDTVSGDENGEHEFKVGDAVELRSSGQVCEILSISKKDVRVDMNGREMRVKISQIRPSNKVIVKQKPQTTVRMARQSIFSTMPLECNLIGMRVDEAMEEMGAYVDEAKIHGLNTFRIIHGDGSGALRSAVHAALKKDKSVKEFRLGMPNEGGSGATIVIMK